MQQQILKMVQAKSEDGHRTVSVCFDLHVHLCGEELPGHTGPDERHADYRQEGREALRAGQTCVLQIEPPGFQSRVQVFSLPALEAAKDPMQKAG